MGVLCFVFELCMIWVIVVMRNSCFVMVLVIVIV